MIWE